MTRLDTTFLIQEPYEVYRAKSAEHLGSHRLSEFRKNPLLFHKKEQGMVPEEDRTAYLLGLPIEKLARTPLARGKIALAIYHESPIGNDRSPKADVRYGTTFG